MDYTIKVKHKLSARSDFFEGKKLVATFDTGGADLDTIFDGKEYTFSAWTPEWIENPVYTDKETKKSLIADLHYQSVPDEKSADKIIFNRFGTKYLKGGEIEIVAHSECPSDGRPEIIVCNNKVFKVLRTKGFLGCESVKIYNENNLVATVKTFINTCAIFKEKMSLKDRIFLTLLAIGFKWD